MLHIIERFDNVILSFAKSLPLLSCYVFDNFCKKTRVSLFVSTRLS